MKFKTYITIPLSSSITKSFSCLLSTSEFSSLSDLLSLSIFLTILTFISFLVSFASSFNEDILGLRISLKTIFILSSKFSLNMSFTLISALLIS
ncbi:hypothetical protein ACXYRR_01025 [Mycoplasma sp. 246B]